MKKFLVFAVICALFVIMGIAQNVVNPDTIVYEEPGPFQSLDPAWEYDTTSAEVIWQLYDSLLQYDGTSTTKLLPMLSTNVPSVADGTILDNGTTYVFHIRQDVYFHNGDLLTPQDVVYSLERLVLLDYSGGPSWMLAEPLLPMINGNYVLTIVQEVAKELGLSDPLNYTSLSSLDIFETGTKVPLNDKYKKALIDAFDLLANDFEIKGNDVIIHLPQPFEPFLYTLAKGGICESVILDEKWCAENKAWDGKADDWWYYHNPALSQDTLTNIENGTGPYFLKYYTPGREVVFQRFDKYWAGPAPTKYAIIKYVNEFTTRLLDLESGQADAIYVPVENLYEVENNNNIKVSVYPQLSVYELNFTFNLVTQGNPYIGSGKLDGNGIPPDFFSNLDVRKGFEYLFPYKAYINEAYNNLALQPNGAIMKGLFGYSPDLPKYEQNLLKAAEYLKKAYNGELWEKGFKFSAAYESGDTTEQIALTALSNAAREINPKFQINVVGELWPNLLSDSLSFKLPIFTMGYLADYPDPYDLAYAYYSSTGIFGAFIGQSFVNFAQKNLDPLVNDLLTTSNLSKRAEIVKQLEELDYKDALYIWTDQPFGIFVSRTWLKGWYPNGVRPGIDFYSLSK